MISDAQRSVTLTGLRQGLRVDGRAVYDLRNVKISFGNETGNCEVQLGRTRSEIPHHSPPLTFHGGLDGRILRDDDDVCGLFM